MVIIYDFRNAKPPEKRRKSCARSPVVGEDEIVERIKLVEMLVRTDPRPLDDGAYDGPQAVRKTLSSSDGEAHSHGTFRQVYLEAQPGVGPYEIEEDRAQYDERMADALYKRFLHLVRDDFSWLGTALEAAAKFPKAPRIRNADRIMNEALDWLVEKAGPTVYSQVWDFFGSPDPVTIRSSGPLIADPDPIFDADRRLVCSWVKSRDGIDNFCRDRCIEPHNLEQALGRLARAIAARLTQPIIAEDRGETHGGQVVIGADKIAAETRRGRAGTLRLIEGGKLPVASVAGKHVSTRDLLRPFRRYGESAIAA
jgi:hypothetical protein